MHVLHGGPPGPIYALYGAREPLLHAPLQWADDAAIHAFIEHWFHTPAGQEVFRKALIAQGTAALPGPGLRAQIVHALQTGVLRAVPAPTTGLHPVKTEPAKAELSGKPFVPPAPAESPAHPAAARA